MSARLSRSILFLIRTMGDFDYLRFDIEFVIKQDAFVPTTKRARSEWAEHAAGKIAERLRQGWEFKRKMPVQQPGSSFPVTARKDS
jgi:hypothetical protein